MQGPVRCDDEESQTIMTDDSIYQDSQPEFDFFKLAAEQNPTPIVKTEQS